MPTFGPAAVGGTWEEGPAAPPMRSSTQGEPAAVGELAELREEVAALRLRVAASEGSAVPQVDSAEVQEEELADETALRDETAVLLSEVVPEGPSLDSLREALRTAKAAGQRNAEKAHAKRKKEKEGRSRRGHYAVEV